MIRSPVANRPDVSVAAQDFQKLPYKNYHTKTTIYSCARKQLGRWVVHCQIVTLESVKLAESSVRNELL